MPFSYIHLNWKRFTSLSKKSFQYFESQLALQRCLACIFPLKLPQYFTNPLDFLSDHFDSFLVVSESTKTNRQVNVKSTNNSYE